MRSDGFYSVEPQTRIGSTRLTLPATPSGSGGRGPGRGASTFVKRMEQGAGWRGTNMIRLNYKKVERWYGSVDTFHYSITSSLNALVAASDYETDFDEDEWKAILTFHIGLLNQMAADMLEEAPELKSV